MIAKLVNSHNECESAGVGADGMSYIGSAVSGAWGFGRLEVIITSPLIYAIYISDDFQTDVGMGRDYPIISTAKLCTPDPILSNQSNDSSNAL
jgi:hypothetical protein